MNKFSPILPRFSSVQKNINKLDVIPCRTSRLSCNRWHNISSIPEMVNRVGWKPRRFSVHLWMMYRNVYTFQMASPGLGGCPQQNKVQSSLAITLSPGGIFWNRVISEARYRFCRQSCIYFLSANCFIFDVLCHDVLLPLTSWQST